MMKKIAAAALQPRRMLAALAERRRPRPRTVPPQRGAAPEKDLLQRLREAGL